MSERELNLDQKAWMYRRLCFTDSTKQTYNTHRTAYLTFCESFCYQPIPVTEMVLCRYVAHLADRLCYNSIKQYINIIRIMHLEAGLSNPLSNNWVLSSILKGVAKFKGKSVSHKLPITPQHLLQIRSHLNLHLMEDNVFWAVCLTLFFTMLRKSNVFPKSIKLFDPSKNLRRCDFLVHPDGLHKGLVIQIRWTKTIQHKERLLLCPVPLLPGHPYVQYKLLLGLFIVLHRLRLMAQPL